jgi:hypothetical protein
MTTKLCTKCGIEKDIDEFPWKKRWLGKRHAVCKTCTAERSKRIYEDDKETQIARVRVNTQRYRQTAREYVLEYLSTHPCSQCGESDPRALEFHHVGEKSDEVSRLIGRGAPVEVIQKEVSQCIVLCANCHRKLTADERKWYKGR